MRNFDSEQVPSKDNDLPIDNKVMKPWGYYINHYRSEKSVLKTIVVNPHSRLSLQSHKKRSETWMVLEGFGLVEYNMDINTVSGPKYILKRLNVGNSFNIKEKHQHRLINDTNKPLVVAEVQIGVCEEDDIKRFEDDYGR